MCVSASKPVAAVMNGWVLVTGYPLLTVEAAEAAMDGCGRVLVRASGTEPLLRVMVEASEQDLVDHWAAHLAAQAEQHLNAA